jgi:hypothetical protein
MGSAQTGLRYFVLNTKGECHWFPENGSLRNSPLTINLKQAQKAWQPCGFHQAAAVSVHRVDENNQSSCLAGLLFAEI